MKGVFAAAVLMLLLLGSVMAAQVFTASMASANLTLQQAESTVAQVNESGYLIFYPNLTTAYADLSRAQKLYNTSPQSSLYWSQQSIAAANAQYQRISAYRYYSAIAMGALTLFFVFLLLRLFTPAKRTRAGAKRA